MTFEMVQSAGGLKVKRVLLALALLFTLCLSAFAQTNSAGLRYDPDAVVKTIKDGKKMSGFYVKVDVKKKVVFFYTDSKLKKQVGEYNLGEQYWEEWDSSKLDPLKIDYKAFYKKIDASKTSFIRTKDGTRITSSKPAPAVKPSTTMTGTSGTAGKPSTGTQSASSQQMSATDALSYTPSSSYVPDAQVAENFVFTARKHPTLASYDKLDAQVQKIKCPASMSIEEAAKKIVVPAKTEREKARALYTWIACNVVYDYDYKPESRTAESVWKTRIGLCQGYTLLYIQMAKAVGLNAEYISGYAKMSPNYKPGDELENHGWGLVQVDGKPLLFDVTFAAVEKLNDLSTFNGDWFDCNPWLLAFSHYPSNNKKLFIDDPLTLDQFKKLPNLSCGFARLGVEGKELYDFFKVNNKAWAPEIFDDFYKTGVTLEMMPFTDMLIAPNNYKFCVKYTNSSGALKFNGSVLKSTVPTSYTPSSNGLVTLSSSSNIMLLRYITDDNAYHGDPNVYISKNNVAKVSVKMMDGSTKDNVASGKPKVIQFVETGLDHSLTALRQRLDDTIDFIKVPVKREVNENKVNHPSGADPVFAARQDYIFNIYSADPDLEISLKFYAEYKEDGSNASLFNQYLAAAGLKESDVKLPLNIYIDSKNKIRFVDSGDVARDYTKVLRVAEEIERSNGNKKEFFPSGNSENFRSVGITYLDGRTTTNQANGRPKVILFTHAPCEPDARNANHLTINSLIDASIKTPEKFKDFDFVVLNVLGSLGVHAEQIRSFAKLNPFGSGISSPYALISDEGYKSKIHLANIADPTTAVLLDYYNIAASGLSGVPSDNEVVYIDSRNKLRWVDAGYGITADVVFDRVAEMESKLGKTLAAARSGCNSFGLPYDSKAVINKSIEQIYFAGNRYHIRVDPEDGLAIVGTYGGLAIGEYDLKEQYWAWYNEEINGLKIDLSQFYSKIDLSKTNLYRDSEGNAVGMDPAKNKNLNSFGLPYDPDVQFNLKNAVAELTDRGYRAVSNGTDTITILNKLNDKRLYRCVYNLREQCWTFIEDNDFSGMQSDYVEQIVSSIDMAICYTRVDHSKTKLNRDRRGKSLGPESNLGNSAASTGAGAVSYVDLANVYIYDPDAVKTSENVVTIGGYNFLVWGGDIAQVRKIGSSTSIGTYDLKNQCWKKMPDAQYDVSNLQLTKLYKKILLSDKTLNRPTPDASVRKVTVAEAGYPSGI